MFWLDEDLPNGLRPGKRPRTTLSPSMVLRDGEPWMSFGTPGGEQQDQWQPIMLARMLDHRFAIQQAIDLPSFHSEHWIDRKSTRLNSSHANISYAVFCLKKKKLSANDFF